MRDFGADSDEDGEGTMGGGGAPSSMILQFTTLEGEIKGPQIDVPLGSTVPQMEELINQLLENDHKLSGDKKRLSCHHSSQQRVACGMLVHQFRYRQLVTRCV